MKRVAVMKGQELAEANEELNACAVIPLTLGMEKERPGHSHSFHCLHVDSLATAVLIGKSHKNTLYSPLYSQSIT